MEIPNTGSSKVTKKVLEYVEGMIQATMNHKVYENVRKNRRKHEMNLFESLRTVQILINFKNCI